MPYRKVELKADHYYHIYNRGNNHENIFFERENYLYFLRQLRKYLTPEIGEVVCYCLMPNHYHFLIYLKDDKISEVMQKFLLSYTKAVNLRYNRYGSLFQGRFKAILIDSDRYLLHLSRYIHLNPVQAKLVIHAQDWEFSSYREYIGLRKGTLPNTEKILSYFSSDNNYQNFVESYLKKDQEID